MRRAVSLCRWRSLALAGALGVCPDATLANDPHPPGARFPAPAQPVERAVATAVRTTELIRLDGSLDEPAWRTATPIGPLLQLEPHEGDPASEQTEVRVLYTPDTLYFGIVCRDRTPSGIVSTRLTRDADLGVDDNIFVILDPFLDNRNGFFFQVNPAGARSDGQVSNNSESIGRDWDGIWDAATRITASGWEAEIEIPFKTLRFNPRETAWGLNVERRIKRLNETDRWSAPRQDVWISNLSEAGRLEGLVGVRQGRGLDVRPYVSGGEENSDGKLQAGLDVFKNVTPNLNASLTVNTDFAETEVDSRQINLTRFPLFYPEKRAFFLEGAGVFDIAGLGGHHTDLLAFFSRRIGLFEGHQVPILVGGKMIGRQSNYNIGVIDARTDELEEHSLDGQNLFAARVSRNLFTQSWVGGIVTHGDPTGTGENTLVGADARFATSSFRGRRNLAVDLFLLTTNDEASDATGYAGGFGVQYPNDLWDLSMNWKQIGEEFQPALGFVPRRGIRKGTARASFQPRPGRGGIRQVFFSVEPSYVANLDNRVDNWAVEISPLTVRMESGDRVEVSCEPLYERLPEPFEISDGITIPAGSYRWNRYSASIGTADKRPWVLSAETSWGSFYDGTLKRMGLGVTLKPSTHLLFNVEAEWNDASLPGGAFSTTVFSARGDVNVSPDVSWANLVQYDSESRELGVQSRFRWILKPGNDVFVVINRAWRREVDGTYGGSFDKGSVKLQYTFRL
jgi:hypothetical protein